MMLSLFGDVVVAALLVTTIAYAAVLNRRLGVLRNDRDKFQELIQGLTVAAQRAEAGIAGLKLAAEDVGRRLEKKIEEGQGLRDDLSYMLERGGGVADRLEERSGPDARRRRPSPCPSASASPRPSRRCARRSASSPRSPSRRPRRRVPNANCCGHWAGVKHDAAPAPAAERDLRRIGAARLQAGRSLGRRRRDRDRVRADQGECRAAASSGAHCQPAASSGSRRHPAA